MHLTHNPVPLRPDIAFATDPVHGNPKRMIDSAFIKIVYPRRKEAAAAFQDVNFIY